MSRLTFLPEVGRGRQVKCPLVRLRIVVLHINAERAPFVPIDVRWCFACISYACPVFHAYKPVGVVHHSCTLNALESTMSVHKCRNGPPVHCVHVIAQRYSAPVSPIHNQCILFANVCCVEKAWTCFGFLLLLHFGFRKNASLVRMLSCALRVFPAEVAASC